MFSLLLSHSKLYVPVGVMTIGLFGKMIVSKRRCALWYHNDDVIYIYDRPTKFVFSNKGLKMLKNGDTRIQNIDMFNNLFFVKELISIFT